MRSDRPLFRWPGAKWHVAQRVQPMLSAHVDTTGGRLLSLFFGTGALERAVAPRSVLAADANAELRTLYAELARDGGRETHAALLALDERAPRSLKTYLAIRASDPGALPPAERAARFLWISCLAFNGLWRVNRAAGLNVPPDPRRLAKAWPFPSAERLAAAPVDVLGQPRATTASTADAWRIASSISPSSTRCPPTFTC